MSYCIGGLEAVGDHAHKGSWMSYCIGGLEEQSMSQKYHQ